MGIKQKIAVGGAAAGILAAGGVVAGKLHLKRKKEKESRMMFMRGIGEVLDVRRSVTGFVAEVRIPEPEEYEFGIGYIGKYICKKDVYEALSVGMIIEFTRYEDPETHEGRIESICRKIE